MTQEFVDDLADGDGQMPLKAQVGAVRDRLKRTAKRKEDYSVRSTHRELLARNFKISPSQVGKVLRALGGGNPPEVKGSNPTRAADERARINRGDAKRSAPAETKLTPADVKPPETINLPTMAALLEQINSSASLAIGENRARMALNTIIMHAMASRPELCLLDMRGAAAMIDALTVAAKLSGGAAIDIAIPSQEDRDAAARGLSPNGHEMKDITPQQSALVTKIDEWRRQGGNGKGT